MLRILRRNLTITITTTPTHFLHYPSLKTLSTTTKDPSLTLHFLKNSCGLSPESAIAASQKLQIRTTKKPNSVLALLKGYGFTKTQIANLVTRRPRLLLADPHKILTPKLEFYRSLGFSRPDLTRLISNTPAFLQWNLKNRLIPNLDLLRIVLHTNENVITSLKKSPFLLLGDPRKHLLPKIETLRNHGLPESVILKLVLTHPRSFIKRSNNFEEALVSVKEMGISPLSSMFTHALGVLSKLPKQIWERRLENYKRLGWSRDETLLAFVRHPSCMAASDEKIRKNMEFFVKKLNWGPAYLLVYPSLLSLSFQKRILPRWFVLRILASKGLFKGNVSAPLIMMAEKEFLRKYVIKYQGEVPEVADAVMGKMGEELDWS